MALALDLRTIYIVCGTTCAILGTLQLSVFFTGRFGRWPLWWSASNLLSGIGTLLIGFRGYIDDLFSVDVGNMAQLSGYLLMIVAVRSLTERALNLRLWVIIIAIAILPVPLLMSGPAAVTDRIIFGSLVCLVSDAAMALQSMHIARKERLYAAWFLMALYIPTAAIFALRAWSGHFWPVSSQGVLGPNSDRYAWFALFAVVFVILRSIAVVLIAAERSQKEFFELAHRDPLTGAFNRAGLVKAHAVAIKAGHAVLLVDIDHFKRLNDTHGHGQGDEILKLLVRTSTDILASEDLIGRHGGDEFVIVLPDRNEEQALRIADHIRAEFWQVIERLDTVTAKPTLSIGVASTDQARSLKDMLQCADEALYRAKTGGRNRVEAWALAVADIAVNNPPQTAGMRQPL